MAPLRQTIEMMLGAGAGALMGTFINNTVKTSFTGTNAPPAWVGGAVSVALGAATVVFAPPAPLTTGLGAGLMAMGAVFATNETFLSLPGISGMPFGVPSAIPGAYINRTVGYRTIPPALHSSRMGNLSGENGKVVSGLYRN